MTKQTKLTVLIFCILELTLHLIADSYSGLQSYEFLYIESGHHLSFGFMEVPPTATAQNLMDQYLQKK